jgi:transglutaminase-like putative cysteine protease
VSWRISTVHTSRYRYGEPVTTSYNELRLTPASVGGQSVLSESVTVSPTTALYRYTDYFSTHVVAFDIPVSHSELVVIGRSVVDTATPRSNPSGLTWGELDNDEARDRFVEYLRPTAYSTGDDELGEIARRFHKERSPIDAVEAVKEWIRSSMSSA